MLRFLLRRTAFLALVVLGALAVVFTMAHVPVFWFGLVLQLVFHKHLSWLPAGGRLPLTAAPPDPVTGLYTVDALLAGDWGLFLEAARHLVLPVITLSTVSVATVTRITRASLLDVLGRDYVPHRPGPGASRSG